jgi:hypothetical protein
MRDARDQEICKGADREIERNVQGSEGEVKETINQRERDEKKARERE